MSRRAKVLIGVIVAVLVLTLGGTAVALADDTKPPATDNTTPRLSILDRVAEILNIPKDDLAKAFNQAQEERKAEFQKRIQERKVPTQEELDKMREQWEQKREQMREQMLDRAVEKGTINDGEKQEIEKWWNSRPPALDKLMPRGGFCPPGRFGRIK